VRREYRRTESATGVRGLFHGSSVQAAERGMVREKTGDAGTAASNSALSGGCR
jgi:hypothetical protein